MIREHRLIVKHRLEEIEELVKDRYLGEYIGEVTLF